MVPEEERITDYRWVPPPLLLLGSCLYTASNKWSDRYKKCEKLHTKTRFSSFLISFNIFTILLRFCYECLCSRGLSLFHVVSLSFLVCCQSFCNLRFLGIIDSRIAGVFKFQFKCICHPGGVFFFSFYDSLFFGLYQSVSIGLCCLSLSLSLSGAVTLTPCY